MKTSPSKPVKMDDYVSLSDDTLPEIANWDTGKEYQVTLKVKMVSKSQGSEYGDDEDDGARGRFKIVSASTPTSKKSDKMDVMKERLKK